MALNRRGRPATYALPPARVWQAPKPIRTAADKLEQLMVTHREAQNLARIAEQAVESGVAEDRAAYATAITEGKGDPGTPREDAAAKDAKDARRRAHALSDAIESAEALLRKLVDEARPALVTSADEQVAAARDRYRKALEALVEARGEFREAIGVSVFVREFPGQPAYRTNAGSIDAITGPNGVALTAGTVLEALRLDVDPPPLVKRPGPASIGVPPTGKPMLGSSWPIGVPASDRIGSWG